MPACARVGDLCITHCSPPNCAEGSPDVFVNGLAWHRQYDKNTIHTRKVGKSCSPHFSILESGSSTVYVNGVQAGRIGDPYIKCTAVAQGSPDVYSG